MAQVEDTSTSCIDMPFLCMSDSILARKKDAQLFTDFVHRHRSDVRVFEQDKWFVNDNGEATLIDDISLIENNSLYETMITNAEHFHTKWKRFINALSLISKKCLEQFGDMYDVDIVENQDPVDWVRSTPLFQKVEKNRQLMMEFVLREYNAQ